MVNVNPALKELEDSFHPRCIKCKKKKTYMKSFGEETDINHVYLCSSVFCKDIEVSIVHGILGTPKES